MAAPHITSDIIKTLDYTKRPGLQEYAYRKIGIIEEKTDMLLAEKVRRFFEILDGEEVSSHGKVFHPVKLEIEKNGKTYFTSVRVMRTQELNKLFKEMKQLSGYDNNNKNTDTRHPKPPQT